MILKTILRIKTVENITIYRMIKMFRSNNDNHNNITVPRNVSNYYSTLRCCISNA